MKRNWMKKLTMMIMILALVLGLIVCAQAELNSGEVYHMSESVSVSVGEDEFPSNEAMAEEYLNRAFYGAKPKLRGVTARAGLTGTDATCYDLLLPLITEVADGTSASTEFTFQIDKIFSKLEFTYAELGLETSATEDEIGAKLSQFLSLGVLDFVPALLYDRPYDLYWYDKTIDCSSETQYGYSCSIYQGNPQNSTITIPSGRRCCRKK